MRGYVSSELTVGAPAADVWAVYSSPELPKLIVRLTDVFKKIDILEGDGHVGTVLHITLAGSDEPLTWNEKFMTIDHEKRLKVVQQIKGGYLDLGFTLYQDIFKIIDKGPNSCIIKSSSKFEVDDKFEANAALIDADSNQGMAKAIAKFVLQSKSKKHEDHFAHSPRKYGA
ncbi:hypothetical protein GIB67_001980 [Kingdonia uniflora]|uniref:Bet v I/Major latex protein domain-containing protein n=1 Tax=Kingdonia uniflora TaxID=39325 RepID=A0A7J7MA00_9MAGN|nr:hypothetical protein GIB67_001980 [Kingdonia uniflora]